MTPKEQQTLDVLRRLTVDGCSPTLETLAIELGVSHRSRVHVLLSNLRAQGVIDWTPRHRNSIRILREGPTREQMARWSSAELKRVKEDAYAILDARLDEAAGAGLRRVSA